MLLEAFIPLSPIAYSVLLLIVVLGAYHINHLPTALLYFILFTLESQFYISAGTVAMHISYLSDLLLIAMIAKLLLSYQVQKLPTFLKLAFWIWVIFFTIGFLTNMVVTTTPLLYVFGLRNNVRFIALFLISSIVLNKSLISKFWSLFSIAFLFNALQVVIQYLVYGFTMDKIGGIFGTTIGSANTYMHIFLLVYVVMAVVYNHYNKLNFLNLVSIVAVVIFISAIAELKIMFIELIVVLLLSYLYGQLTWRKIANLGVLFLIFGALFSVAIPILYQLFPDFNNFFSLSKIIQTATNSYTGQQDLSRLFAISDINKFFFHWALLPNLFGIGLGSAEVSNTSLLMSQFYLANSSSHYDWFSLAFLFIETGFLGLVLYLMPFGICWYILLKSRARDSYHSLSLVLLTLIPVIMMYNNTLRIDAVYMLAIPLSFGISSLLDS